MPRNDGTHPERPRRHHKPMHSSRHGNGHDYRIRKAKRRGGDRRGQCPFCGRPTVDVSRHKRSAHPRANQCLADHDGRFFWHRRS